MFSRRVVCCGLEKVLDVERDVSAFAAVAFASDEGPASVGEQGVVLDDATPPLVPDHGESVPSLSLEGVGLSADSCGAVAVGPAASSQRGA